MQESILSLPIPPRDTSGNLHAFFARGVGICRQQFFPGAGNCVPPGTLRVCLIDPVISAYFFTFSFLLILRHLCMTKLFLFIYSY